MSEPGKGKSLRSFWATEPNSEFRDSANFGVLRLVLGATSYDWRFESVSGAVTDTGSDSCH